jgi:hypothetical protein
LTIARSSEKIVVLFSSILKSIFHSESVTQNAVARSHAFFRESGKKYFFVSSAAPILSAAKDLLGIAPHYEHDVNLRWGDSSLLLCS